MDQIVIVGAGHAGFQCAAALRQNGFAGAIVVVGNEGTLPYQRPPLSKAYLLGKVEAADLRFRPACSRCRRLRTPTGCAPLCKARPPPW